MTACQPTMAVNSVGRKNSHN